MSHSAVQVGTVAFFLNPSMANFKSRGTKKDTKHPHLVINVDADGYATCIPMTSKGDVIHERNVNHFIPPEACSVLSLPSWLLPQMERLTIHISEFPKRRGILCESALAICAAYFHKYESDWKVSKAALFVPFANCTYDVSNVIHFPDAMTLDVYAELGLPALTLSQAKAKAKAAIAQRNAKQSSNQVLVRH
jgi:hypothetical protein